MIKTVSSIAAVALLCVAAQAAQAQAWPAKPIRYVVPFPPAGATDILARFVGEKLSPALGQAVVIENRPGAAGNVGTDLVAKSAPDGYTILMLTVAQTISETLYTKLPYSLSRDFSSVALVARVPNVMEVHPSVPAGPSGNSLRSPSRGRARSTSLLPAAAPRSTCRRNSSA